jgi:hypothetical protein
MRTLRGSRNVRGFSSGGGDLHLIYPAGLRPVNTSLLEAFLLSRDLSVVTDDESSRPTYAYARGTFDLGV